MSAANLCPCACELAVAQGYFAAGLINAPAGATCGLQNQRIDRAVVEGKVPDPGSAVLAAGQDRTSVGTKLHDIDRRLVLVGKGRRQRFAGCGVPDPSGTVLAASRQSPAIGAEVERSHLVPMMQGRRDRSPGRRVPDPRCHVFAGRRHARAIGAVGGP